MLIQKQNIDLYIEWSFLIYDIKNLESKIKEKRKLNGFIKSKAI